VFLHQLHHYLILALHFVLKGLDPRLVPVGFTARLLLKGGSPVFKKPFLPAVKNRGMKTLFIAQIRDRDLLKQMTT
jgi:hypothetical protein